MLAVHCTPWCTARAVHFTASRSRLSPDSKWGDNGPRLVDRFRVWRCILAPAGKLALTHRPRSSMYILLIILCLIHLSAKTCLKSQLKTLKYWFTQWNPWSWDIVCYRFNMFNNLKYISNIILTLRLTKLSRRYYLLFPINFWNKRLLHIL